MHAINAEGGPASGGAGVDIVVAAAHQRSRPPDTRCHRRPGPSSAARTPVASRQWEHSPGVSE